MFKIGDICTIERLNDYHDLKHDSLGVIVDGIDEDGDYYVLGLTKYGDVDRQFVPRVNLTLEKRVTR